jgi:hypothetical protein
LENYTKGEHRATRHDCFPPAKARRYKRDGYRREESADVLQRDHDGADGRFVGVAEIILVGFEGEDTACENMLERECCDSCQDLVAMGLTYDACIVPEQEARSTDEEAEEVGSEGTKPRARKLRHGY